VSSSSSDMSGANAVSSIQIRFSTSLIIILCANAIFI
jgi:hypothetical protein